MHFVLDTAFSPVFMGLYSSDKMVRADFFSVPDQNDEWLFRFFTDGKVPLTQVEKISIGRGPGSFTGLRAGFTFARVMSSLREVPVLTFDSMEFRRRSYGFEGDEVMVLQMNRNMYYGYIPEKKQILCEPLSIWKELLKTIPPERIRLIPALRETPLPFARDDVFTESMWHLSPPNVLPETQIKAEAKSLDELLPLYGHKLDYELQKQKKNTNRKYIR